MFALVLAACGGGGKSSSPTTPKQAAGPSCEAVADSMVNQMLADKDPRPPDDKVDVIRNIISSRCDADGWTLPAKQCLSTMKNAQDADRCASMLTEQQQAALVQAEREKFGTRDEAKEAAPAPAAESPPPVAAPPPPPAAPKSTRSKAKRNPASTSSDPCQGGE